MLDMNLVRNNPEIIEQDLKKRGDKEKGHRTAKDVQRLVHSEASFAK